MVKVSDFKLRHNPEGKAFFALELQGGLEVVRSASGNSYLTAKKATIPTTFSESTCRSLLGTELPGSIKRIECDPYDFTVPQTGEVIRLSHRYEYVEEETVQDFTKVFKQSENGVKVERA